MEEQNLSRRDRRKILREEQKEQQTVSKIFGKLGYWVAGLIVLGALSASGFWLYKEVTKPLPGQEVSDMGANHVTDISGVLYNSDPPTSGPHFSIWAKRGVYDRVLSDGHLIHSLEHGYVIISYNCKEQVQSLKLKVQSVFAHEIEEPHEEPATPSGDFKPLTRMAIGLSGATSFFTPNNAPPVEVELPESFKSEECKNLVDQLDNFLKDYQRVIIVPRPTLDSLVAITAWGRIEKLEKFDHNGIKAFIDAYHNKGPEKTQE